MVVVLGHDASLKADDDHLLLLHGVYHTSAALVERDVGTYGHVAREVLVHLHMQRAPCAKVAPAKVGREDVDLVGVLKDGIVHRDVGALGEVGVYLLLFTVGVEVRHQRGEDLGNFGLVDAEGIDDGAHVPDEDARVPEVVVLADVSLCRLRVGLLLEGVHTENLLV